MPPSPLVTVVTPFHNDAAWLEHTVDSVQGQSFGDWELLLINDRSGDGSDVTAAAWARSEPRIRLLSTTAESRGAAAARNKGIEHANGRYIAFLDADDLWLPTKLEQQLAFMSDAGAAFSYTAYEKMDEGGRRNGRIYRPPTRMGYNDLLRGCAIGCSTVMIDAQALGPPLMPPFKRGQDYATWLEITRSGVEAHGLQEPLAVYRERRGSLSSNKLLKYLAAYRIYREQEQLGVPRSLVLLQRYALHALRKRLI